jgi:hypothetical protein
MNDTNPSSQGVEATTDAVFQEGSPVAPQPASGLPAIVPSPPLPTPTDIPTLDPADAQVAPVDPAVLLVPTPPVGQPIGGVPAAPPKLDDYVRELGREYQEQQNEGRL